MIGEAGSEAAATTPGAALASAREHLGLSVADVAGQMRISPRQVEAIEADRYQDLPGAVFVRGFVRNYARLLRLDPVPLLHALEPALGPDAPLRTHEIAGALPVPHRRGRSVGWRGLVLALVACVLAAGLYEYVRQRTAPVPAHVAPVPVAPPPVAAPQPPETPAAPAAVPSPPADVAAPENGAAPASGTPPPQGAAETRGMSETTPAGGRSARIEIAFVAESWVEIRDRDGTVVFSGTGALGTTRMFEAPPPLQVTVGNASGVRITYNERPFDVAAHATRNIARFTLE